MAVTILEAIGRFVYRSPVIRRGALSPTEVHLSVDLSAIGCMVIACSKCNFQMDYPSNNYGWYRFLEESGKHRDHPVEIYGVHNGIGPTSGRKEIIIIK